MWGTISMFINYSYFSVTYGFSADFRHGPSPRSDESVSATKNVRQVHATGSPYRALPDQQDPPACTVETGDCLSVSRCVPRQLPAPKVWPGRRHFAQRASMHM